MTVPSKNGVLEQINDLFLQIEDEILKYNWYKVIELLKKVEEISSAEKENLNEIRAAVYYKLGEIYQLNADFERNMESVLKNFQLAIDSFEKAHDIYKLTNNTEKIYAALGFINFLKYIQSSEEGNEEDLLSSAKECFNRAKEINLETGNIVDSLKMKILESRALNLLIGEKLIRIDEHTDMLALASEYDTLLSEFWEEIKKQKDFPETYIYHFIASIMEFCQWALSYLPAEKSLNQQYVLKNLDRMVEFIDIFENSTKNLSLFMAYTICSWFNTTIAAYFVDNQFEQKKYLKIAEKFQKKAQPLLSQENSNTSLIVFYYVRFTVAILLIALGFFARDFKHAMEDFDRCISSLNLYFPKILVAHSIFYVSSSFAIGALTLTLPEAQRIMFAKIALDLVEMATKKISMVTNPEYKIYNLFRVSVGCAINAILGDLIKDEEEKDKYEQIASKTFNEVSDYSNPRINNTFSYYHYLFGIARTGIILAKNATKTTEEIKYHLNTIDLLERGKNAALSFFRIQDLFLIGELYYEVGMLTNDDEIFKKAYSAYIEAIDYCKNKGYSNLVGSGYVNLARIDDRLGNFLSASKNYKMAIDAFDQAILTLTYSRASKKIEKLRDYMKAWSLIEVAKSYHLSEEHDKSQLNYEEASIILKDNRDYSFEAPFYSSWAFLEKAEFLSKENLHQEAAATYLVAKGKFEDAIETFESYMSRRKISKEIDRISRLIMVAKIRISYCTARHQIETARLESRNGNHLSAAELYNKAGVLFYNICQSFRIKREKDELTAIYYLCKAWENMEQADLEQKASLYASAAELFEKASGIFQESRMKKLSIGNSLYCTALEFGSRFDESTELERKINCYKKIKLYLREAAKNYKLGGFEQDAQWALGTSTFFDGVWHLIQADNEIDFSKKNQYLNIATNYLNNSLTIFEQADYYQKKEEIQNYLEMIKNEKAILTSALNVIEKPEVSTSSIGISAPTHPVEISSSVSIEEMQETDLKTESEINWHKRVHYLSLYFQKSGICIYDYTFKSKYELSPHLISGGITGIASLIQELTRSKSKVKIVEQEEMTILLEYGKYISAALITEENLITLRNKLVELIDDVEEFFQEELENFSGDIEPFSKIGKFVQRIFEI
ncbi:MAG: hypothetical protein ACFFCM_07135, partial [Promethearchaeota archaeon]